jgi:hypothetical protein
VSHPCPARCGVTITNDDILMCRDDWYRVTPAIRALVNREWNRGRPASPARLRAAQLLAVRAAKRARAA